eukprot:532467-Rhodomonas_salina.1
MLSRSRRVRFWASRSAPSSARNRTRICGARALSMAVQGERSGSSIRPHCGTAWQYSPHYRGPKQYQQHTLALGGGLRSPYRTAYYCSAYARQYLGRAALEKRLFNPKRRRQPCSSIR